MTEPLTLYKLMVLFMLDKSKVPIPNTMFATFFLEKDYTSYFTVQVVLHELDEAQFLMQETTHNNVWYTITDAGRESLHFFEDQISLEIQTDIRQYLKENQIPLKDSASSLANYYLTPEKKYAVHCRTFEKGIPQLDLTITVPNKTQAEIICSNWKKQTTEIYALLMDQLLK